MAGKGMKKSTLYFVVALLIGVPLGAHAELVIPEPPPPSFVSFTFNDAEADAEISSTTPSVVISVSTDEDVYFTRLSICPETADPCDANSSVAFFSPDATTTMMTNTWDGTTISGAYADPGVYRATVRFYRYAIQPEALEETAPFFIHINTGLNPDGSNEVSATSLPTLSFLLNNIDGNATIASTTPEVSIAVSASDIVYFSQLYICPELQTLCDDTSNTMFFDINATSTEFSRMWDGTASSSESVGGGYRIVVRYFAYDVSPDVAESTATSTVFVVVRDIPTEEEPETPPPPPVPTYTLIPSGTITSDQTWIKEGSPYVIEGAVSFLQFRSFTIEPGVVVKFKPGATLSVHASTPLTIAGTKDEPVIFTSFKDDTAGGDTNNDGAATEPAPGDWGYASFGAGSLNNQMDVRYLQVRYGGGVTFLPFSVHPALALTFQWFQGSSGVSYDIGTIAVSHSADVGLYVHVGRNNNLSISNSSFHDNATFGVLKAAVFGRRNFDETGSLNLSGSWWGSDTGPTHTTLNPEGVGDAIDGTKISLNSWLPEDPFILKSSTPIRYDCCSSVVFLPGFEGSILASGSNTLWPPTFGDVSGDLEKLAFEDGQPVTNNVVVDGILNNFLSVPVYQGFSDFMDGLSVINGETGTSTIKAWKPLAYDWRYGPDEIVGNPIHISDGDINLVQEIENLAANSYTGKVTLVAHSYGGLVGKALIKKLAEEGKADLIDTFIMVGTPQLGTPQAVAGLLHGDRSDFGFDLFGRRIVTFVSKNQARDLGGVLPSAYTLLPSSAYFQRVLDPVLFFDLGGPKSGEWRAVYDKDKGVTTYNDMISFLTAALVPRTGGILGMPKTLNSSLIAKGKAVHDTYDSFGFPETLRVVQLAGWGLPTIKNVTYSGGIAKTTHSVKFTTEGDKTVVYPSAIATDAEKYFLNLDIYNVDPTIGDFSHINLLNLPPAQDTLKFIFTNIPVRTSIFVTSEKPEEEDVGDKLIVSAHSPVTLGVTDQFGNYTGITPGQDPDADILTITTDIPGSSYFTVGDAKYLILPDDGQYTFVMGGTGEGEVTVIIETLSGDEQTTTATYNFSVSESSQATFVIENSTPGTITLDQDGDGNADEEVFSDEAQAAQEEQQENNESETSAATTSIPPSGGGGPLWTASPALSPVVLGVSTTAEATTSPTAPSDITEVVDEVEGPIMEVLTDFIPQEPNNEVIEISTGEADNVSITSTNIHQQASAIQTGWYDIFVRFIKNLLKKSVSFFKVIRAFRNHRELQYPYGIWTKECFWVRGQLFEGQKVCFLRFV